MKIAIITQPLGHITAAWSRPGRYRKCIKNAERAPVTINRRAGAKGPAYHVARLGYHTLQKILGKRLRPINIERHSSII